MNTPKPTLKNLQRGLVAIYHGNNLAQHAVNQLNIVLSVVWPRVTTRATGGVKYYFKSASQDAWDASNGTRLPSYPVSAFLNETLEVLKQTKELARADYAKVKHTHTMACRELITNEDPNLEITILKNIKQATSELSLAVEILLKASIKYSNASQLKSLGAAINDNKIIKKQVRNILSKIDTATNSVEEFCEILNKLQITLKQLQ